MRVCKICGLKGNINEFANAGIHNGVQYRRHICIKCYSWKKYQVRIKNRERLLSYKGGIKCSSCGNNDHRVMEFHHRDPKEKDRAIADMMSWSWSRIQKELDKCDALCANCHRILHYELREEKKSGISSA